MKILFIGNSHTYFNDMPWLVENMMRKNGIDTTAVMLAHPGVTFDFQSKRPDVRYNLLYGDYDYVVMQQAAHPFPGTEALLEGAREIMKNAAKKTKGVALMTWAERIRPENQEIMKESYVRLAKEQDMLLAPVGLAWWDIVEHHKDLDLFFFDGEHASPLGSLVIATMVYRTILGKLPEVVDLVIQPGEDILYRFEESHKDIVLAAVEEAFQKGQKLLNG